MSGSLAYRRDHRSTEEFARDVEWGTLREGRLMRAWATMVVDEGIFDELTIADNGVDNTGGLITDESAVTDNADFLVATRGGTPLLLDGEHLIEVKYCPCLWKATYKVGNLRAYIEQGAKILTIWGRGQESPERWSIVGPEVMQNMLKFLDIRTNYPGQGGKPAVLVHEDVYGAFYKDIRPWVGVYKGGG